MTDALVKMMEKQGIALRPGLTQREMGEIENHFDARLPKDLAVFLSEHVLEGRGFYDYRKPASLKAQMVKTINDSLEFDITQNNYWSREFGDRPKSDAEAVSKAQDIVASWPPLFPIYRHRYAVLGVDHELTPVISLYQFTDAIIYGFGIEEYLENEFGDEEHRSSRKFPNIPKWSEALELPVIE